MNFTGATLSTRWRIAFSFRALKHCWIPIEAIQPEGFKLCSSSSLCTLLCGPRPCVCSYRGLRQEQKAYQDFFALWKDADPDVPILKEAKAEYERLQ